MALVILYKGSNIVLILIEFKATSFTSNLHRRIVIPQSPLALRTHKNQLPSQKELNL